MLEISHVTKKYRDKEALSDVSLTIPQGQIVGLLGENGAGKTTLMKCILGYLRHKGVVTLDGEAIGPGNIHRLSFATCEHSFFPALSPADHRDFYQAHFPAFNDRRFRLLTEFFQLPLHKPLRSFSTGMKNQLEVTLALSQGADYILMDEPFSGSDLFNREDFYRVMLGLLSDHETVILSTAAGAAHRRHLPAGDGGRGSGDPCEADVSLSGGSGPQGPEPAAGRGGVT